MTRRLTRITSFCTFVKNLKIYNEYLQFTVFHLISAFSNNFLSISIIHLFSFFHLQENEFTNHDRLVEFWDQAHYIEEEIRQKKSLSPLSRFRVRRRNPPPRTICASGVRKTSSLPKEATAKLKTWYFNHESDPYPTVLEKQQLARVTGLTIAQVKTWFANARRRSKTSTHHSAVVDPDKRRCIGDVVGIENYTSNLLKSSSYCKSP